MSDTVTKKDDGYRILIVDDHVEVREVLLAMLGFDGHTPEATAEWRSAMTAFTIALESDRPFDLVIADMMMPGMNGIELGHYMKNLSPETPIILLSGRLMDAEYLRDAREIASVVAAKPVGLKELRNAIEEAMREFAFAA